MTPRLPLRVSALLALLVLCVDQPSPPGSLATCTLQMFFPRASALQLGLSLRRCLPAPLGYFARGQEEYGSYSTWSTSPCSRVNNGGGGGQLPEGDGEGIFRVTLWPSQLWGLSGFLSSWFVRVTKNKFRWTAWLFVCPEATYSFQFLFCPHILAWKAGSFLAPLPIDILRPGGVYKGLHHRIPKEFYPWLKATALILTQQSQKYTRRDWNVCYPKVECSALLICFSLKHQYLTRWRFGFSLHLQFVYFYLVLFACHPPPPPALPQVVFLLLLLISEKRSE